MSKEVGSDSLILGVWMVLLCRQAETRTSKGRWNPVINSFVFIDFYENRITYYYTFDTRNVYSLPNSFLKFSPTAWCMEVSQMQ